jgi:Na+/H+-dicarboxylate symporters
MLGYIIIQIYIIKNVISSIRYDDILCNFRDRFRTTINVLGDSIGAGIVDHMSKAELLKITQREAEADRVGSQNGELNAEEEEWHTTSM